MQEKQLTTLETPEQAPVVFAQWKEDGRKIVRLELRDDELAYLKRYWPPHEDGTMHPTDAGINIPREVIPMLREALAKLEAALAGKPRKDSLDQLGG
jgi:hypothetical protein